MKKKLPFLIIAIFFIIISPVLAISKDQEIYKAFQEILDRDPTVGEYHSYIKGYKGYEYVKKSLNSLDERKSTIANIYQQALKRNPRDDELDTLVKFVAPNNLIRKQLYESKERELAIIDAYQNFLGRNPVDGDLAFYVNTRSPFEKIKEVLNTSSERRLALINKYKIDIGIEPNKNEIDYMIENKTALSDIDNVRVLGIEYIEPVKIEGPITISFFNDFECLYCGYFHKTLKNVKNFYGDQLIINLKHFPLPFHEQAYSASVAYECAKEQNKEDEMIEKIYLARAQDNMSVDKWKSQAVEMGANSQDFNECLDGNKYLDKIESDISEGENLEISGTPTIVIESQKYLGNIGFDELVDIITNVLQ